MKTFITDDFLLSNEPARILYHEHASRMPVYDFHCHLNPVEILENRQFDNLAQAWLGGDHYKWRLLRAHGVSEAYVTGDAPDEAKFRKFAEIMPSSIGNPIYHWSHLELLRSFQIDDLLSPETADSIWAQSQAVLKSERGRYRSLIRSSHVTALCTTDDPADDLSAHRAIAADAGFPVKVLPTYRPEAALHLNHPAFRPWVARLQQTVGHPVKTFDDLKQALETRAIFFKAAGCRLADQSLEAPDFTHKSEAEAIATFSQALNGASITKTALDNYQACLMHFLGTLYARLDFTMQLHLGVQRNLNTKLFREKGADIGCDAIGNPIDARSLAALLDGMAQEDLLPRTVLYSLIPGDLDKLATVAGCFQSEGVRNKIQLGSAWWYSDTLDGMTRQLTTLANVGLLAGFVGMLTVFAQRAFLCPTRILPPPALRHHWRLGGKGHGASRLPDAWSDRRGHLLQQRRELYRLLTAATNPKDEMGESATCRTRRTSHTSHACHTRYTRYTRLRRQM